MSEAESGSENRVKFYTTGSDRLVEWRARNNKPVASASRRFFLKFRSKKKESIERFHFAKRLGEFLTNEQTAMSS